MEIKTTEGVMNYLKGDLMKRCITEKGFIEKFQDYYNKKWIPLEEAIELIKEELRFLESDAINDLVREADLGSCHELCGEIEERRKLLKQKLKRFKCQN